MLELVSDRFAARVLQETLPTSVRDENADVHVRLPDGRVYGGVIATARNLAWLMERYATTGECASGSYIWVANLVLVRDFEPSTLERVLDDLVRSGELEIVFASEQPIESD